MKKKVFLIIAILIVYICVSYNKITVTCTTDPVFPPERDLPISWVPQLHNMWCAHACVVMWARYKWNYGITQEILAFDPFCCDYPYPDKGLHVYQIARAVNKYAGPAGLDIADPISESSKNYMLSRITEGLRVGQPSILPTLDRYANNHAIIVKGYKEDEGPTMVPNISHVTFIDPFYGNDVATLFEFRTYTYEAIIGYLSESDRFIGIGTYALWLIIGLGNRSMSEINQNAASGYADYLERCGTYYGGPTIYIPEGSTFLRVRSPQGNETLAARKSDQVIWESNGLSGKIRLELYKNDSFFGTLATNLPIENGSITWTVGDYINGSAQTGDDYRIKVSMMDDSYDDFSNVNFSIGDINVTIPNGGETWEQGSLRTLTWANSYFTGNVQLLLVKTIPGTDYLIADNIENTGSYEWQVGMCSHIEEPEAPLGMTLPGDNYKIKVVSVDNPDLQDSGDQLFSIVEPQPGITVVSPNGGGNWQAGSIGNITCNASRLSENVKITLWQNGAVAGTIATPVDPALGTYSWTVGQYVSGTAQVGNGYTIKIKEIGTAIADFSDASFTIKGIKVTSPDGGENWQAGSTQNITWAAPGVAGDLKITLWQNGVLVGTIVAIISPVLGSYSWTVGQHSGGAAAAGSGYTIKIKERDTAISDTGDASFSLSN